MTSHDLNRAFEAFAPTAEQEQAMLDRLLTEQKEVRPVNRIKKMTVVLVAAALMLMACAFTVVTGLDQRILSYFGGGEEQAQLVSGGVVEVEKSFRYENGWAIHIRQVLADRYSLAVLAEVVAPEGTVLDGENYYFELGMEVALDLILLEEQRRANSPKVHTEGKERTARTAAGFIHPVKERQYLSGLWRMATLSNRFCGPGQAVSGVLRQRDKTLAHELRDRMEAQILPAERELEGLLMPAEEPKLELRKVI